MICGCILDVNISPHVKELLLELGINCYDLRDNGKQRLKDKDIISLASQMNFAIITSDNDFSKIMAQQKRSSPSIITLRLYNPTVEEQCLALRKFFERYSLEEIQNCFVTLEKNRFRIHPLPV